MADFHPAAIEGIIAQTMTPNLDRMSGDRHGKKSDGVVSHGE
jgi:hypothetical protein